MNNTTSTNCQFIIDDPEYVKTKVLNWLKPFGTFAFLDNHRYGGLAHSVECLAAAGVKRAITASAGTALLQLQQLIDEKKSWLFGHLGYDLKNETENLVSAHPDLIGFPDLYFFEPEIVIRISGNYLEIDAAEPASVFEEIMRSTVEEKAKAKEPLQINSRLSEAAYIHIIRRLKEHILRGDCYEINFCQEFFAANSHIDPLRVYSRLSEVSPNPFSACYKMNAQWLLCASPERFLKKTGNTLISQPIKGTSKRILNDPALDNAYRDQLAQSAKDRSENVMVVDLVRNDLAKICKEGSVKVDELFGVYSFPQVHQMISTISGELEEGTDFSGIIQATFPMGSMTGAPKKRVMELIEEYEVTRRGIFSGAMGYIAPGGDFDFNVVIRSIMYNSVSNYISFQAGSGITYNSDPQLEWEECLLKAEAIKKILEEG